jgi:hypothetical protein
LRIIRLGPRYVNRLECPVSSIVDAHFRTP